MLSKYSTLILEETEVKEFDSYREEYYILQEGKKIDAIKKAGSTTANVVDKAFNAFSSTLKSLHNTRDDKLVENLPEFSKVITRSIMVGTIFYINPVIGLISLYTTIVLKKSNDQKKRNKLISLYTGKLEFVEDKLGRGDIEDEEKMGLIKMKNKLRADIEKLKRIKDERGE